MTGTPPGGATTRASNRPSPSVPTITGITVTGGEPAAPVGTNHAGTRGAGMVVATIVGAGVGVSMATTDADARVVVVGVVTGFATGRTLPPPPPPAPPPPPLAGGGGTGASTNTSRDVRTKVPNVKVGAVNRPVTELISEATAPRIAV